MIQVPMTNKAAPAAPAHVETLDQAPFDPFTLQLKRPIRTHEGETRSLKLREPNASDYIEVGKLPFNVRGDADNRRVEVDFRLMAQWASRLTGVDEVLIGQLGADDWLALTSRVNTMLIQAGVEDVGN